MAKQNTINHDKTYDLADRQKESRRAALGTMEAFWDWVGQHAETGDVTKVRRA